MDTNKFKELLQRYFTGESSNKEKAQVEAWYKSYQHKEKQLDEADADRIGRQMRDRINASITKTPVIRMPVFRIAASLIFGVGLGVLIWHIARNRKVTTDYLTIRTGTNDIKQVTLPDSSVVWVNSASILQVPAAFQGNLREVKLLEGEAFFDVKHKTAQPFIVHVKQLNVQVLGTSFNIKAYKGLNNIDVAVATGKVGVMRDGKTLQMLLPDQLLAYNSQTGTYLQKHINASQVQGWRSGNSYLNQANFAELALAVKNIFGISLKAGSNKVNDYRFTLYIKHNITSQQVLKIISQIHNTQYRKEGDSVILY